MPLDDSSLLLVALVGAVGLAVGFAVLYRRQQANFERAVAAQPGGGPSTPIPLDPVELQRMADTMEIGLLRMDRAGSIMLANDAGHRYLGWPQGSLVGKSTMEAFVDHRIDELVAEARVRGSAVTELASGGEPQRTLLVRARRVWRDEGVWLVLEDVSELRRLQRIRAEFIDNLSHELRTPLTNVRLLIETLALELERTELPPRVRDSIQKIDVETGHLVQMVNELIDLSKIEQGDAPLEMTDVDLGPVIESAVDRLRLYAERQGVALRGEMPAAVTERTVRGDAARIGQLLLNLLHNAVKFSAAGDDVTVRLVAHPAEVLIEVEDHGVGIPRRDLDRVFERFYKVDRARSREGGGTGLGLAIARHIAERHGGRIWIESEEGRGARFFVALPRPGALAESESGQAVEQDH